MYWLGWQWRRAQLGIWQSPRSTSTSSKRYSLSGWAEVKGGGAKFILLSSNTGRNFLISGFLLQKDGRSVTSIKRCFVISSFWMSPTPHPHMHTPTELNPSQPVLWPILPQGGEEGGLSASERSPLGGSSRQESCSWKKDESIPAGRRKGPHWKHWCAFWSTMHMWVISDVKTMSALLIHEMTTTLGTSCTKPVQNDPSNHSSTSKAAVKQFFFSSIYLSFTRLQIQTVYRVRRTALTLLLKINDNCFTKVLLVLVLVTKTTLQ